MEKPIKFDLYNQYCGEGRDSFLHVFDFRLGRISYHWRFGKSKPKDDITCLGVWRIKELKK